MKSKLPRYLIIALLTIAFMLALSPTALAAGTPKYIYYVNQSNQLVLADYEQAVDDLFNDNPELRNAILTNLITALQNFKAVYVEDEDGTVIDYAKAVTAGLTYPQAFADNTYHAPQQSPVKELIIDPVTGEPVERDLIIVSSLTAVNGTINVVLNTAPATAPVITDFTVTRRIDAGAATAVTPTNLTWNLANRTATLTVPLVTSSGVNQSVVMSVAYKSTPAKSAPAFTVPGNLAVVKVEAINHKEVEVTFNQPMDPLTAQDRTRYTFSGAAAGAVNVNAAFAGFTDSTNTKIRLVTAGTAAADKFVTTDTAVKLQITGVQNAGRTQAYSSPAAKESVGPIAPDLVNPTVVSVTPLGVQHFEVVYSKAVIGSLGGDNHSARKGSAYKIGATQLTTAVDVPGTDVTITNPSDDLRTYLLSFASTATDVVPLIGGRTIWVNNHAVANNKVQDYAGNNVPITSRIVTFEEDLTRPTVESVQVLNRTTVRVTFSELIKEATFTAGIANVKWGITTYGAATKVADAITYRSGTTYDITFTTANAMPASGAFKLWIPKANVVDLSGNVMLNDYEASLVGQPSPEMLISAAGTTTQVVITFSRNLANDATIITKANYKIDGAALPGGASVARTNNITATITGLTLADGPHTVTIENLKDEFGDVIPTITAPFNSVGTALTSVAVLDSNKVVVVFNGNLKIGQQDNLAADLIVDQGGPKDILSVVQVNLSEPSTVNRQFIVTLSDTINPEEDVTVKTRSALSIATLDVNNIRITANTTGLASKGFAAAKVLFDDGSGNAATIADLDATDVIRITFNRNVQWSTIKTGWSGSPAEAVYIDFDATDNTMIIEGVGTLLLKGVAADDQITPEMVVSGKELVIPMTGIKPGTNADATTFTFTPASMINDIAVPGNDIDFAHILGR